MLAKVPPNVIRLRAAKYSWNISKCSQPSRIECRTKHCSLIMHYCINIACVCSMSWRCLEFIFSTSRHPQISKIGCSRGKWTKPLNWKGLVVNVSGPTLNWQTDERETVLLSSLKTHELTLWVFFSFPRKQNLMELCFLFCHLRDFFAGNCSSEVKS